MNNEKRLLYAGGLLLLLGLSAVLALNTASSQETPSDPQQGNIASSQETPSDTQQVNDQDYNPQQNIPIIAPIIPIVAIPVTTYVYSAKFVCGVSNATAPVLNGNYATAVNVHNPYGVTANFVKKVVIALREGRKGNISNYVRYSLKPDEAFEIDCPDIADILKQSNIPMPSFAKGFVVIQSPNVQLDTVAVYTAGGANVESIDVETVNPKTLRCIFSKKNITAGINDNFSLKIVDPLPNLYGTFDNPSSNNPVGHKFTFERRCGIVNATLTIHVKALGGLSSNDTISLGFGVPGGWGSYFGTGNSGPALVNSVWDTEDLTFVWDLSALPAANGNSNLLTDMNDKGFLIVGIQDDTKVDYMTLSLEYI